MNPRDVNLYNVDGTVLVATVEVPTWPEGYQDVILYQDHFYLFKDSATYWEAKVVTVL
jgi:hypothetical protein